MCRKSELIPVRLSGIGSDRPAILIKLNDSSGNVGWGESAPYPQFGTESYADSWSILQKLTALWVDGAFTPELAAQFAQYPASWHGMELAWLHLMAQEQNVSVAELLNPNYLPRIQLNAVIGNADQEKTNQQTASLLSQGFRCIKLKIGDRPFLQDLERILAVQQVAGKDLQLRLDVNQKWTIHEAIQNLKTLGELSLPIQYVEQPVSASDIDALAEVRKNSPIAIAGDEAIRSMTHLNQAIQFQAMDYVILKPMLIGGIIKSYTMGLRAIDAGIKPIVTNSFDGYWAWYGALQLASALEIKEACGLSVYQSYSFCHTCLPQRVSLQNTKSLSLSREALWGWRDSSSHDWLGQVRLV